MNEEEQNEQPLSRQAYRQQHGRTKQKPVVDEVPDPQSVDLQPENREMPELGRRQELSGSELKTQQLKRKLNITIGILIVAIIVVYLILFFVG